MFFHITSICKLNHLKTTLSLNWTVFEFIRFRFSRFLNPNTSIRKVNLKTFYASGSTHVSTRKKLSECYSLVKKKTYSLVFVDYFVSALPSVWVQGVAFSELGSLSHAGCRHSTRKTSHLFINITKECNLAFMHPD